MTLTYRALWLSDIHLGTRAARVDELVHFLSHVCAEEIFLVGDIVDLIYMRTKGGFGGSHMRVLAALHDLHLRGTRVTYVPGNHDAEFRALAGTRLAGIPVEHEVEHVTAQGRRMLVMHGDALDGEVRHGTRLERFGAAAYYFILGADVMVNQLRRQLGRDFYPLSAKIKRRIKSANDYIERYEVTAARHARARGFDGIICGHIHKPCLREIDGVLYANDGDWVEHAVALSEDAAGELRLIDWRGRVLTAPATTQSAPLAA
ncbi:MAG: UDP-2,3-diacylglucosamine diphosphatase [Pseudomonadota bacterium]